MQGLMQPVELTVDRFLDHAAEWHPRRKVPSRTREGRTLPGTYADVHANARRVSSALASLGIAKGDRVGTLAWNTRPHLEAWYGIMGMGAVCHTLNPRLFPEQLAWIINHAEDRVLVIDGDFTALATDLIGRCPSVTHVVVMEPQERLLASGATVWLEYDQWIEDQPAYPRWGTFDERTACGLCYTSGTTGDPKGVLYSHRSNYLHTLVTLQTDAVGLTALDVVAPLAPMFHANAWGHVFAAPATGAALVMPGSRMDGPSIYQLFEEEGVTVSAAVPTVWQMLLKHLDDTGARLSTLQRVLVGGAAVPEAVIRGFQDGHGIQVLHGWGMTETSPMGTGSAPTAEVKALSADEQVGYILKQGRPPASVQMKITDEHGTRLPHDGVSFGHLKVRGPFVAGAYFKGAAGEILDAEGYFDTGDVATIDALGFMQITDRAKDVIKSGGEWISSITIENIVMGHPQVARAAVVGVPHPKWDERPLLVVQLEPGQSATKAELLAFLKGKIAKWWMPDDVSFVDDIPLGATGKIDKKRVRASLSAEAPA